MTAAPPSAADSILTAPYSRLRSSAVATSIVFGLSGGLSASWVSRLPEVRNHLHADPGELGLALLMSGVGSILFTPITGLLVRRFGARRVVAATCVFSCLAVSALGFASSVVALGAVLFFFGMGYGAWDVSMNVHGHAVEHAAHRAWMPRYHAVWSVGGFTFAGIGTALSHWHVPIRLHFALFSILAIGGVFFCLTKFFDERPVAVQERAQLEAAGTASTGSRLALAKHLIPLGVVMGCATLIEGAASDWLGIYFNTDRGTSPAAGSAAFTLFSISMALARGAGTWTIEKIGRAQAVRLGGATSLVGVAILLLSPVVGISYAGAALWGLGVAIIFPAVVSAAGDTPGRAAEAISLVTPIGYSGFLFGPPAIGLIAHVVGLNVALWLVGLLAIVTVVLAGRTRERDV